MTGKNQVILVNCAARQFNFAAMFAADEAVGLGHGLCIVSSL